MAATSRAGFRLLLRCGQPQPLPRAFVDRMYDDFDRPRAAPCSTSTARWTTLAPPATSSPARWRYLTVRRSVLWGRHDPYIGVQHAERERRAFPHAEIRVLDHAGHWPFVDQPNKVVAAVTAFLARHTGARTLATLAHAGRCWPPAAATISRRPRTP